MLSARQPVRNLKTYHPPLGQREGLRLDFNENTVGCSPRVLERLRHLGGEQLARYPDRAPLEAAVAAHLNVTPEELLLTNGTDEAIHLVCETYLEAGDEALIVVPTFSMYEIYAAGTGARVISIPAEDFRFPTELLLARINTRTRFIAVANPNNPTGSLVPAEVLLRIAQAAPNAALLVDEAYFEFCGETLIPHFRNTPNLFISRTFSKAYGLAGLRIGVLSGDVDQMKMVRLASSPYNVNSVALACLPDAIEDRDFVQQYVHEVGGGRDLLEQELQLRGIKFWPSRANFVLMLIGSRSTAFIAAMRARGILVRDRSSDYGCEGCVRITLGNLAQTEQMLKALREVLGEIGISQKAGS